MVAVWCTDMCKLATIYVLHWHFNHCFEVYKYIPSGEPLDAKGRLLSCRAWKEKVPLKVGDQTKTDLSTWSLDGDCIYLQNWTSLGVHVRASELYKIWPLLSCFLWKQTSGGLTQCWQSAVLVSHCSKPKGSLLLPLNCSWNKLVMLVESLYPTNLWHPPVPR